MLCVEGHTEDFVTVCGVDWYSVNVNVKLCFVFSWVWGGYGDLCFVWVELEFVLCCPCVYLL